MRTKIIGLTGGIGSGKTTIVNYIASKGIPVYIADDGGRKVMQKAEVIKEINALFKGTVLLENGQLNREKIAALVFENKSLLKGLNKIVHPAVAQDFNNFLDQNCNAQIIVKEAAILFESGSYKDCDATILITAPVETRIKRVMKRDGIDREAVLKRMKNQMSDEEKRELADFVIQNIELKQSYKEIDEIIKKVLN